MMTQRNSKSQNSEEYEPTICLASVIRHATLLLNNNRAGAEKNVTENTADKTDGVVQVSENQVHCI